MKIAFHTLGCKVNQYETESIKEQFEEAGYEIVHFNEIADIYIVNTCTVTNIADKKSRQMLKRPKKLNSKALIIAIGCYVQREDLTKGDFESIDLVIGNTKKGQVFEIVEGYIKSNRKIAFDTYQVESIKEERDYDAMWLTDIHEKTRAHLKVQDGCNQFCAYCIIPYVRGRVRSRAYEDVIREVKTLVDHGFKEVVLTGIHLASYSDGPYTLIDLIEGINDIEGIKRIRLGSLEPNLMTEGFILRLKKLRKVCPHFHLSLQSGCDCTLKAMNRKYDTDTYRKIVNRLKDAYVHPAFTTDIIVGFPGETDQNYNETKAFVSEIGFMDLHVFKYSIREGTKAASMSNQIDGHVKELRSKDLIEVGSKSHYKYLLDLLQTEQMVLVEQVITYKEESYYMGHTDTYVQVLFKNIKADEILHEMIQVRIENVGDGLLFGSML